MRKEIELLKMVQILTLYENHKIICKEISSSHQIEENIMEYHIKKNKNHIRIWNSDYHFILSLEPIKQIGCDTGKSVFTKKNYVIITMAYEQFHYVSLNIEFDHIEMPDKKFRMKGKSFSKKI